MLLLTSCGQQHQAESVVEDVMNEHLKETADLQITSFGKIDSTRHINDSIIISLREATKRSSVYKDDIEYATAGNDSKLIIVRVTYTINGTKHQYTGQYRSIIHKKQVRGDKQHRQISCCSSDHFTTALSLMPAFPYFQESAGLLLQLSHALP